MNIINIFEIYNDLWNDETIVKIRETLNKIENELNSIDLKRINAVFRDGIRFTVSKRKVIGLVRSFIQKSKDSHYDYIEDFYYDISPSHGIGEYALYKSGSIKGERKNINWKYYRFNEMNVFDYAKYLAVRDLSSFVSRNKKDLYNLWNKALQIINKNNFDDKFLKLKIYSPSLSPKSKDVSDNKVNPASFKEISTLHIDIARKVSSLFFEGKVPSLSFRCYITWSDINLNDINDIARIWNDREDLYNVLEHRIFPYVIELKQKYNNIVNSKEFRELEKEVNKILKYKKLMSEL